MLLLPGQHNDALVHEISVQVSAAGIPYAWLVEENGRRSRSDREDNLVRVAVEDRGSEPARLHMVLTVWFPEYVVIGARRSNTSTQILQRTGRDRIH